MSNEDETEEVRRTMLALGQPYDELEKVDVSERWDTQQMSELFIVHSFLAPFAFATRKSDGKKGALMFTHSPRYYFNFVPNEPDAPTNEPDNEQE